MKNLGGKTTTFKTPKKLRKVFSASSLPMRIPGMPDKNENSEEEFYICHGCGEKVVSGPNLKERLNVRGWLIIPQVGGSEKYCPNCRGPYDNLRAQEEMIHDKHSHLIEKEIDNLRKKFKAGKLKPFLSGIKFKNKK